MLVELNDLIYLEPGVTYWFNIASPIVKEVEINKDVKTVQISISSGGIDIKMPSNMKSVLVTDFVKDIPGRVLIQGYLPDYKLYDSDMLVELNDLIYLEPGVTYWFNIASPIVKEVEILDQNNGKWYLKEEINSGGKKEYIYNNSDGTLSQVNYYDSVGTELVSITYHFIDVNLGFIRSLEVQRQSIAQPGLKWMNETIVPGFGMSISEAMGLIQLIPMEGSISTSGKAAMSARVFVADDQTIWKTILSEEGQNAALKWHLDQEDITGQVIFVKSTSKEARDLFNNVFIKRTEDTLNWHIEREINPTVESDIAVVLPDQKDAFWKYITEKNMNDIMTYVKENTP